MWIHFIRDELLPGEGLCGGTLIISSIGKNPGDIFEVIQIYRNRV